MASKVFGIGWTLPLASAVAELLRIPVCGLEEERFLDGELKLKPTESVEGAEVFVFHSLIEDPMRTVNDRLCELHFLLSSLRDSGAGRVTANVPYLCYSRSDRRVERLDPVNLRYVAQMLEAAGLDRLIAMDVHNVAAFENAFRKPLVHLEASELFCKELGQEFAEAVSQKKSPVVLSPDIGGIKRAERFRRTLSRRIGFAVDFAFLEKTRGRQGVEGHKLHGEVEGRELIIVDDMISTGETVLKAAAVGRERKARKILVCATHGLFVKNRIELLDAPWIDRVMVTDSHPALSTPAFSDFEKLKILSCAPLYAEAIRRLTSFE